MRRRAARIRGCRAARAIRFLAPPGPPCDRRFHRHAGAGFLQPAVGRPWPAQRRIARLRFAASGEVRAVGAQHRCGGARAETRARGRVAMRHEFDVIIIGAGAVGAATAGLLVARGVTKPARIALVDARLPQAPEGADWDLRVFALSRASERVLRAIGAWERLPPARACAYERVCVWDAAGSPGGEGSLSFDCALLGEPNLGSIVDGRELVWHCLQAARHAGVVIIESGLREVIVE